MLFISFGRRGREKENNGKRFSKPFGFFKLVFVPVVRVFASSALAKTLVKKIKDAEKQLAELDKKPIYPSSIEYQKELKQLYNAKYGMQIKYWEYCLDFARKNNAGENVLKEIEKQKNNAVKEFGSLKDFLK